MDTENLLRQIAAVPLGPLAVSCVSAGADAWTLTVTLADRSRSIRAEREPKTEGVVLTCRLESATQLEVCGSWITEDETVLGGSTERRLWIHGDGLNAALLLNALAELARVAAEVPGESGQLFPPTPTLEPLSETAPKESVHEEPVVLIPEAAAAEPPIERSPLTVETPPEEEPSVEPAPEPAPTPRAKLLPWQSLGTVPSPKPPPMPEEVLEPEVVEAMEPAVLDAPDAPDPEVSTVETPAMETAAEPDRQVNEPPATTLVVANGPVTPALPPTPAVESPASTASASFASRAPQPVQPSPEPAVLPVPGNPPQPVGHTGTCRECGTPFAADHAFCTNCGIRLT